jgi:uncharacterized protein (DUF1330 family)
VSQATIVVEGTFQPGYEEFFPEYSRTVRAFLDRNQGTVVRRQRVRRTLYGPHAPDLIMVIDFPDAEVAERLFLEGEYLDLLPLRDRVFADFRMYLAAPGEL